MAEVRLEKVCKIYPGSIKPAVRDFSLEIRDREFLVLVGSSGCGKTTILRLIAGLEEPTQGKLYIGGRLVNRVPPQERDIAMVFQSYALYPHMSVYENMAFGLKMRKYTKDEIGRRVRETARMLEMEELLDRKPMKLSGGQRQRVALGRAIVLKPQVFLMDEPLSNLDAQLRTQMRAYLSRLMKQLETTCIYVTHDQTEAMTMGDRIVVMKDGVIQQAAPPEEVYHHPANVFVAGFIGSPAMNLLNGELTEDGGVVRFRGKGIDVAFPEEKAAALRRHNLIGREVIFGVRPEDIHAEPAFVEASPASQIHAHIEACENLGREKFLYLNILGAKPLIARTDSQFGCDEGDNVKLAIDMRKVHLFDAFSGMNLFKTAH